MADANGKTGNKGGKTPSGTAALADSGARVLENLAELEPQLINAGIFDSVGNPVALTGHQDRWPAAAAELLAALEAGSGEEKFDSAHIASAEGEVFVVSESGLSLVAVTSRFVLASLTSYDIRMSLRDLAGSGNGKASSQARKRGSEDA